MADSEVRDNGRKIQRTIAIRDDCDVHRGKPGYVKRRNPLANELWEMKLWTLVQIGAICGITETGMRSTVQIPRNSVFEQPGHGTLKPSTLEGLFILWRQNIDDCVHPAWIEACLNEGTSAKLIARITGIPLEYVHQVRKDTKKEKKVWIRRSPSGTISVSS